MAQGRLIVFEGIDGSGKTTQIELLARALKGRGTDLVCTREPGGTGLGDRLRKLLLNTQDLNLKSRAEAFLYAADRAQHVEEVIKPALARGETVLCDRFIYSTLAYQGWGRGMDIKLLTQLNALAAGGVRPKAVILLDLEVAAALGRVQQSRAPDRLEKEQAAFFRRVRRGYLEQAAQEPHLFHVVPAQGSMELIHMQVLQTLGLN